MAKEEVMTSYVTFIDKKNPGRVSKHKQLCRNG
jgi:hypothetical protein